MSTKYIAAGIAVVALAVSTSEARSPTKSIINIPSIYEEEQRSQLLQSITAGAAKSPVGSRPFDEEQEFEEQNEEMVLHPQLLKWINYGEGPYVGIPPRRPAANKTIQPHWPTDPRESNYWDFWRRKDHDGNFIGCFEDGDEDIEQRAKWKFDASVSGGGHSRKPQWSASIGATWEEDEEQELFFSKLNKSLDAVDRYITTHNSKSVFDEDGDKDNVKADADKVTKAVKAVRKIKKLGFEAAERGFLSRRHETNLRAKFTKLVNKIEEIDLNIRRRRNQIIF